MPTGIVELPALPSFQEAMDAYDPQWLAVSKKHIEVLEVIGQKLQQGVPKPIEDALKETAVAQRLEPLSSVPESAVCPSHQ